jgi:adenylate cyclase
LGDDLRLLRELNQSYERETDAALQSIRARAVPEARRRLPIIDSVREQLGGRLEDLRSGMFGALKAMSAETEAAQARTQTATIIVFVLSSILGIGVAVVAASRLIRAIKSLVQGAEAIEGGNLETRIEIASGDEIGRLAASFNRMTEGLRMRDRIRVMFGRYVDRRIA